MAFDPSRLLRFSVSQANSILRCPIQWWNSYGLGIKTPPAWALEGGSMMDAAANYYHQGMIDGTNPTVGEMQDVFIERFKKAVETFERWNDTQPVKADDSPDYDYYNLGPKGCQKYVEDAVPHLHPATVQEKIEGDLDGVPMLGYLDLREEHDELGQTITDIKFGKTKYEAEDSLQMHVYDALRGKDQRHVKMVTIKKNKVRPSIAISHAFVTDQMRTRASAQVLAAWRLSRAALKYGPEILVPRGNLGQRGDWPCSPRFCGYWSRCIGSKTGRPELTR